MSVDMTVEEIKECVFDTQLKIYYNRLCEAVKHVIITNKKYHWKGSFVGKIPNSMSPLTSHKPATLTTGVTIHGKDISYFRKGG